MSGPASWCTHWGPASSTTGRPIRNGSTTRARARCGTWDRANAPVGHLLGPARRVTACPASTSPKSSCGAVRAGQAHRGGRGRHHAADDGLRRLELRDAGCPRGSTTVQRHPRASLESLRTKGRHRPTATPKPPRVSDRPSTVSHSGSIATSPSTASELDHGGTDPAAEAATLSRRRGPGPCHRVHPRPTQAHPERRACPALHRDHGEGIRAARTVSRKAWRRCSRCPERPPCPPPNRDSARDWLGQIAAWALSFTVFEQIGPPSCSGGVCSRNWARRRMLIGVMVALIPIGMATQAIGAPVLESPPAAASGR